MTASANLDLVRSIFAAWERGDFSSAEWADPEIEYVWVDGPAPGRWTGLAEMAQSYREWLSVWQDLRIPVEEYRELDDERVLVLVRLSGRGKSSGLDVGQLMSSGADVFHICEGKVIKFFLYWDRDRALADLGLAPEGDSP